MGWSSEGSCGSASRSIARSTSSTRACSAAWRTEYGQLVEERLNKHVKTGTDNKVHVVLVPLPRAMLLPALVDGKVDLVAAQVTVTPELQKLVDFTNPTRMNVSEILVTGGGTLSNGLS